MKSLLIRCEATAALGTGHVLRCLALAQEWMRRGGRVVFAMAEPEPVIVARLEAGGGRVVGLRTASGSAADAFETAALAQRLGAGWLVVDGPLFGPAWEAAWSGVVRVLRIDDNGLARPFRADLLLNQNLGAGGADYPAKAGACQLLLGPEFALLRPEFLRAARARPVRSARIVVTLGGTDPACATERVLEALQCPAARELAADLIVGAANPRRIELVAAITALAPRLQPVVAPGELAERFAGAQLAVTAGGTTLYELALLCTPMLVLCTAENQRRTCERFAAVGAVQYAGWHADIAPAELAAMVAGLVADARKRAILAELASQFVDGHGAARVVEAMIAEGGL
ncbi:MAG: UDP-2,4-diacetamido-2,4,6-trideoxy-beta-L-altropyranose hydrolase [Opitutaceae bacterium]|nr:UDP-2,4-diacetamido-2,4,6-trideoxy-beta-L-altropyranose hydrolase [Opitutaceae bacterium]